MIGIAQWLLAMRLDGLLCNTLLEVSCKGSAQDEKGLLASTPLHTVFDGMHGGVAVYENWRDDYFVDGQLQGQL